MYRSVPHLPRWAAAAKPPSPYALTAAAVLVLTLGCRGAGATPAPEHKPAAGANVKAPATPAAPAAAAAPAPAPGFIVMDLPAIQRAVHGSRGRVLLVHFWATWCYPCLDELPLMEKLARDLRPRGVEILSLSLDDPEKAGARVSKVLAELAPSLTRSIARVDDTDAFIGTFGDWEGSIPALFAYDAKGKLRGSLVGETDRQELDALVGRLLPRKR